jgi:hypothetical protein
LTPPASLSPALGPPADRPHGLDEPVALGAAREEPGQDRAGQCRTPAGIHVTCLGPALLAALAIVPAHAAPSDWPPFLAPRERFAAGIAAAVERVRKQPTFSRSVESEPAPVPLASYLRFVDAPDLTAAAARHLGLARYEVHILGDDWYQADDHDGAHGVYRVLQREGGRRVILSWGTHRGAILGTVAGSALTLLEFDARGGGTAQRLRADVLMESGVAARLTRTLLPVFGWLVDRKLTEGFRVTAHVAEWGRDRPREFCDWLGSAFDELRRRELLALFGDCGDGLAFTPGGR